MSDNVRWKNGKLTLSMSDTDGIELGKILGVPGTSARAVKAVCTVKVSAALAKAGGLTTAQQDAVLKAIKYDFKYLVGAAKERHPYKDVTFYKLRDIQAQMMEATVTGYNTDPGLATPLVVGTNSLTFEVLIPLGHAEFLDEAEELGGAGAEQLRTATINFKTDNDPLKALDVDLSMTEVVLELYPDARPTPHGALRWAVVPEYDATLKDSDKDELETRDGVVLAVNDKARPLSTNLFQAIRVSVGGLLVVDDPKTPKDVEAYFLKQPDTNAIEASIADRVTPMYRVPDSSINELATGPVSIKQVNKVTGFDLEYIFFPVPTEEEVEEALIKLMEQQKPGEVLHAVNAATVLGLKVKDEVRPIVGFYVFKKSDPRHAVLFEKWPGLRMAYGKRPEVWIPQVRLAEMGQRYYAHRSVGDVAGMTGIVQELGNDIPGAVISSQGYTGGVSNKVRDVRLALERVADQAQAREAARAQRK